MKSRKVHGGVSAPSQAWLFAQLLLGRPVPRIALDVRDDIAPHDRKLLEWAAQFSARAAEKLRELERMEQLERFHFRGAVSAVLKVVSTLGFCEAVEDASAERPEFVDGPFGSIAEQFLELGERQFDGVQVGRVRGQITELGANCFDGLANSSDFVAGEIVLHHNSGGSQVEFEAKAAQNKEMFRKRLERASQRRGPAPKGPLS